MLHPNGTLLRTLAAALCLAAASSAHAGMERDLAMCTAAEGRPSAAACTRVMNSGRLRDEDFYIGYYNRADALERAGDFDAALADANKVVTMRPKFARGYVARAFVQDDLGASDKALADLEQAIRLKDDDASVYLARAVILRGRADFAGALADLKHAGDLDPKHIKVRLQRTLVLAESGDMAGAGAEADAVFAAGKPDAAAYYVRAAILFAQDRLDAAEADLKRALSETATFAAAHTLLGRVHEKRGDRPAAKAQYEAALASMTGDFDRHLAKKTARERLAALGGAAGNVALNEPTHETARETKDEATVAPHALGCKRFLPAIGTVIEANCE
jgi:tetratricopeptide (TPR) repeat protein